MNRKKHRPLAERAVEAVAALTLGAAVGFGAFQLTPLAGAALWSVASLGAVASGWGALALLGGIGPVDHGDALPAFEPAAFDDLGEDELLLDDPIPALSTDSRIIRLFEREQPEPLPEPGELVLRIADYLETGRGARPPAEPEPALPDASAALHAALADIRRSLRSG